MHATARHTTTTRTSLRLAWGMLAACLLASALPALAANGRNPSVTKAARELSVAKAASQAGWVAQLAPATPAPAMPALPRPRH